MAATLRLTHKAIGAGLGVGLLANTQSAALQRALVLVIVVFMAARLLEDGRSPG